MINARQIHLVRRPNGVPVAADFALVDAQVADAGEGEIQVSALLMSVDPYMRPRLNADQALDTPLLGGGIGRVVQSRNARFKEGDLVRHGVGFREVFLSDGLGVAVLERDPALPLTVYMHALGGTGITAYGGLLGTGALKDGEQVFISTAAGAVGSVAAQIAKIKGCWVVGSTGTDDKAAWLRDEVGLDAVINYKTDDVPAKVKEAAGGAGIRVWYETQPPTDLDRTVELMAPRGRVVVMAGRAARPEFPNGPFYVKGLSLHGFAMFNATPDEQRVCGMDVAQWLGQGKIKAVIGARFPLADAAKAHELQEANTGKKAGTLSGKIVVLPTA